MPSIKIIYGKNIFEMKIERNDSFEDIVKKYLKLLSLNKKELLFLYKGKNILENKKILNRLKKDVIISVFKLSKIKHLNESPNIICPECNNLTFISINDDGVKTNDCSNKHTNTFSIYEFIKSQNIELNEIKCDICQNNKYLYDNDFFICTCKKIICQLCMINHIKKEGHNLLYYNKRNYNCNKHLIEYVSFCSHCNTNLCEKCEKEHDEHKNKIIFFKKIIDKKIIEEKRKEIEENIIKLDEFNKQLNIIKNIFNNFINNLIGNYDNYNALYKKLLAILSNSSFLKNYENIKNILNFNNRYFFKEKEFKYLKPNHKIEFFVDKFKKNFIKNKTIEYSIIYNINEKDKRIKLFGSHFIENNKNNCFLKVNNQNINLTEYYDLEKENKSKILKVILIGKNKQIDKKNKNIMTNISYMFHECNSLSSLTDFSNWNTINIENMYGMFYDCNSLINLPDISKWNTNNAKDMNDIFYKSNEFTMIYGIKKYDIKIKLFDSYFVENNKDKCYLIINDKKVNLCDFYVLDEGKKPKILKVKLIENNPRTNKIITNMSRMFYQCKSLLSLPDISKWNTINVIDMSDMFYKCESLSSLPAISKWDTNNVIDMSGLFYDCISLLYLPDISKWNTSNVNDMSGIFYNCKSLLSLPDISKWDTSNVIDMSGIFWNCKSLSSLPDISKWDTSNAIFMGDIFYGCRALMFMDCRKIIPYVRSFKKESKSGCSKFNYKIILK